MTLKQKLKDIAELERTLLETVHSSKREQSYDQVLTRWCSDTNRVRWANYISCYGKFPLVRVCHKLWKLFHHRQIHCSYKTGEFSGPMYIWVKNTLCLAPSPQTNRCNMHSIQHNSITCMTLSNTYLGTVCKFKTNCIFWIVTFLSFNANTQVLMQCKHASAMSEATT